MTERSKEEIGMENTTNEMYEVQKMKVDYELAVEKEKLNALRQERKDSRFFKFRSQIDFTLQIALWSFIVWASITTMKFYGVI